jgi:hypothetical protein
MTAFSVAVRQVCRGEDGIGTKEQATCENGVVERHIV